MRLYRNQFFKTKEEARTFQKSKKCGTLFSNVKGSRTKKYYKSELLLLEKSADEEFISTYPFVVAWNEYQ